MASHITPDEIAEMKQYLIDHPIDHAYDEADEMFDGKMPSEQFQARCCYDLLESIGELPE